MNFTNTNSVQYELTFHFWGFRRKITTVANWKVRDQVRDQVYRCVAEQLDNQLYSIKVHLKKHTHGNKK